MNDTTQLLGGFTALARALVAAPDKDTRLKVAVDAAVDLVTRCDHAGITINDHGRLVTRPAVTTWSAGPTGCRPSWSKVRAWLTTAIRTPWSARP